MTPEPFIDDMIDNLEKFKDDMNKIEKKYSDIGNKKPDEILFHVKFDLPRMALLSQALFSTVIYQAKMLNHLYSALEKLPNTTEFNELKHELEKQKKDTVETLLPIKKLSEALESSRNRKLDYIG